jgi:SNF2 family DNA or RNA helicase
LRPSLFPSEIAFDRTYLTFYNGRISGSKNEDMLNKAIDPYRFKKSYEEIADQLPTQTIIQKYCSFTKEQQQMNDLLMEEIEQFKEEEGKMALRYPIEVLQTMPDYQKLENNIVARQNFAQMLADSEDLLLNSESDLAHSYCTGGASSKVELCVELVRKIIESDEKVVIFSRYLKIQNILEEAIQDILEQNSAKTARITGAVSSADRNTIIHKFNDQPEYKVLFASDAAEAGINIPAAKYMIEFELAESAAKQTQRHGRIQRADSIHKSVFVYQLICRNSFDEIAMKIVSKKEKYANDIL